MIAIEQIMAHYEGCVVKLRHNDREETGILWVHFAAHVIVLVMEDFYIRPLIMDYQNPVGLVRLEVGGQVFEWQDGVLQ